MMNVDDLFPIVETLEILGFAEVQNGIIHLTPLGKEFSDAHLQARKTIFSERLLSTIPLAHHIRQELDHAPNHRVSEDRVLDQLEHYLTEKEAERVLRQMIDWGRYAEIFAYDFKSGVLSLEDPGTSEDHM